MNTFTTHCSFSPPSLQCQYDVKMTNTLHYKTWRAVVTEISKHLIADANITRNTRSNNSHHYFIIIVSGARQSRAKTHRAFQNVSTMTSSARRICAFQNVSTMTSVTRKIRTFQHESMMTSIARNIRSYQNDSMMTSFVRTELQKSEESSDNRLSCSRDFNNISSFLDNELS